MFVILDSTAFWDDPNLKSGAWALLIEYLRRSQSRLFVPAVVVEETEANFARRFEKAQGEARNAVHSLIRLIDGKYDSPQLDKPKQVELYSKRLDAALRGLGAEKLPYPNVSHEELVKRNSSYQKPFQERGTGYKDALIWYSALELLRAHPEDTVLVTKNSTDFSESKESPTVIHPDLKQDLNNAGVKSRVNISVGIDAFLDEYAKPTLKKLDDLRKEFEKGNPIDLKKELHSRFNEIFEEINQNSTHLLKLRRFDLRRLEEPIGISSMDEEPIEFHIDDVLEFRDGEVYLEFTGEYEAEMFGYLPHTESYSLHDESTLYVTDWNWNDHYVQVGANVTLRISFRAVFDLRENEIVDFGIKEVNTDEDAW